MESTLVDLPLSTSPSLNFDPLAAADADTIDFDISIPELTQFKKELEETREMLQNIQSWKENLEQILFVHGIEISADVKLTKAENDDDTFKPLITKVESLASFHQPSPSESKSSSFFYEQANLVDSLDESAPISIPLDIDKDKDEPPIQKPTFKLNENKKEHETNENNINSVYKNTSHDNKNIEKSFKKRKITSATKAKATESFDSSPSTSSAPISSPSHPALSHLINVTYNFPPGVKKQPSEQNKFFGCKMCSFSSSSMSKTLEHVKFEHFEERKIPCESCPHNNCRESDLKLLKTKVHKRAKLIHGIKSNGRVENVCESSSSSSSGSKTPNVSKQNGKISQNESHNPETPFKKRRQKLSPIPELISKEIKSILDLHIASKNDEPPFVCRLCPFRSVISRGNARLHIYETHPQVHNHNHNGQR